MGKRITYKILFLSTALLLIGFKMKAQCNDTLVELAIQESGPDAIFIKEYKVKFKKGKSNKPAKVAKYSVYLKDSTSYRFNVLNAKEFDGKLILQLYRNGKLMGSTYDFTNLKYNNAFDFECEHTDRYQIYMSFIEGKAGCAVGILSMLVNDSTVFDHSNITEVLYRGIDNQIVIAYTEEPDCSVLVSCDQGTISGQNGKYRFKPDTAGTVTITAQTIDNNGEVKEEISKLFKVKELPEPKININGNTGGIISKAELLNVKSLGMTIRDIPNTKPYEIIEFSVSDKISSSKDNLSDGKNFTLRQKTFIEELESGDQLFITNIKVLMPDDQIIELKPIGFIIQ